ncbi:MAG: superoxide dismutase, partial [Verrucomicrobiota bacterium]
MAYTLPDLGYDFAALEPHIDARTMEIHFTKHHAAYVANVNNALAGKPELEAKCPGELIADLKSVPEDIRTAVRNNGGGHVNHSLFWKMIAPGGAKAPSGELATAIEAAFGSLDGLKEAFGKAALTRFGSGWAWLCSKDGKLAVC